MIIKDDLVDMTLETPSILQKAEGVLGHLFPQRKIDRVLLINPPDADVSIFRYATAARGRYTNYPPYGLAVIAQNLRAIGVEVMISNLHHEILKCCQDPEDEAAFDFDAIWQSKLEQDILDFQPDLIGVTCMFTMTHTSFRNVCTYASRFNIPLGIGGVHVTNDVERVLADVPCVDITFIREGDRAMQRFVQIVKRELSLAKLAQVILRDQEDCYRFVDDCTPSSEDISQLPAYDLLDIPEYATYGTIGSFYCFKPAGTRFATVLSNRGCRARCTFCSVRNFNGPSVRQRTIASVVDELALLQNEYGVSHIMWLDDDLLKHHARAVALFNEMIRRGIRLTWDATNGVIAASCIDEVIAAAAESGCIALNIGMESGNPRILRDIKKPGTVETFLRAAEVLRKYEQIYASVFLMLGFPGETMGMILDTMHIARAMDLDWYRISQLQPLPNTPIYNSMVEQGLVQGIDNQELRFMVGSYGKQTEIEQGLRLASIGFEEAFVSIPLDAIPTPGHLTDIWFYMNYHLNFHRLFSEENPSKIERQLRHLRMVSDVISPEHGTL